MKTRTPTFQVVRRKKIVHRTDWTPGRTTVARQRADLSGIILYGQG